MHRRSFLASSSALMTLALLPYASRAQQTAAAPGDGPLNALFNRIFFDTMRRAPEFATAIGIDKGPNAELKARLSDRSLAARKRNLEIAKGQIAEIEAINPATLSDNSRIDREVVLWSARSAIAGADKFDLDGTVRPFAIFQQGGAYFSTPDFLNSAHTVTSAADAEAYLARLDAFATVLDQETEVQAADAARGYVAPDFALDLTIEQMVKLRSAAPEASGLATSLARRATAANVAGEWGPRAAAIVKDKVYPALDRQIALIRRLRANGRTSAGVWGVPRGDELYAEALKASTTTNLGAEEIHRIGIEQVAEISAELDTILKAQGLSQGSVGARLTQLNARPDQLYADTAEGRRELIASLNADNAAMQAKLARAFNNPPNAPLDILAVPVEIQDGASNGYYRIAAIDGSRPAIYFINLKSVADWPKYSLPALTYHEGVPGHHLQLTLAQKAPTPFLRKISFFGAYSEGWALYAEQLADELGGYARPVDRAGYLQSFLFRAARLVIDTGLHHKRWSREQAVTYLVDTVGFARPRSQREIERYCTQPGQATSYKIGHTSWVRARAKAQAIAGAKFDLKRFHDVLNRGAVPLVLLEQLVEADARAMASA